MTMRARLAAPVAQVVEELNMFLRGWAGYFRYGNSARAFDKIRRYALMRLALFLAKRHQRGRADINPECGIEPKQSATVADIADGVREGGR